MLGTKLFHTHYIDVTLIIINTIVLARPFPKVLSFLHHDTDESRLIFILKALESWLLWKCQTWH